MKYIKFKIPLLITLSIFSGCSSFTGNHYSINEYSKALKWKENFIVCQIGDLHYSTITNLEECFKYLDKLIYSYSDEYNVAPDLIVLNGDIFMHSNEDVVKATLKHFDSLNIPFCFNYGNHDLQGDYSPSFIQNVLYGCSNSLLVNPQDDDVYGNSNYIINLNDDDDCKFKIIIMDTNSYIPFGTDCIHEDQINWYERIVSKDKGNIKSLLFTHIPDLCFNKTINDFKSNSWYNESILKYGDNYFDVRDMISRPFQSTRLFESVIKNKSTVGISCNHNHNNNVDIKCFDDKESYNLRLIYGSKSSFENYYIEDMVGVCFYTLFSEPKVSLIDSENKLFFDLKRVHLDKQMNRVVVCKNEY